jgi:hypothetical protein
MSKQLGKAVDQHKYGTGELSVSTGQHWISSLGKTVDQHKQHHTQDQWPDRVLKTAKPQDTGRAGHPHEPRLSSKGMIEMGWFSSSKSDQVAWTDRRWGQ